MFTYEYPRPMLTADCVVLNRRGEVLLVCRGNEPYRGCWALPGGFMEMDEPIERCAVRELREETALEVAVEALRLVGVYSALGRDPRGRTVTVAYAVRVADAAEAEAEAGDDAAALRWWPLESLPPLAFDHAQIIADAIR